ncbi:alpha/beta-hydrolase [Exidia glandulosa HHB12029]|uniref:Alpha/beta-hydrolase n=1 Tax=Exidia glandulosa HHB12029 TaxID=1314781 RepID=A0A166MSC6_EXIGL|nr:alpha/beta-hydrolase [Exidia glandulosa HHB12029]
MSLNLEDAVDLLRSPRALGALACVASVVLLARSALAFEPPRPITIAPAIDEVSSNHLVDRLRVKYPKDIYPNGSSFHTPWGKVQYWVMGESGPKVVLVHGLSIPAPVWLKIAPELVRRGYQVLLYDIFGRGYTAAPDVPYTPALYTTQLALLLQHLKWPKAKVVGLSMASCTITAAFAADHPHLVDGHIALIAPVGLMQPEDFPSKMILGSSELVQTFWNSSLIREDSSTVIAGAAGFDELVALQAAVLPGFARALGSSLRDGPLTGLEWAYTRAASTGVKVLHIHGVQDVDVDFKKTSETIAALIPQSKLVKLDGAGHDLCYDEYAGRVADALDAFLRDA